MSHNKDQANPTHSPLFMGIDAGTSGIRACVIDQQAKLVAEVTQPLPAPVVSGVAISQSPRIWASVFEKVLATMSSQCPLDKLHSIAIDGTSGTVLLADQQGEPIGDALMYNDGRSQRQVNQLTHLTDNTVVQSVSAGLPKLMWLLENLDSTHPPPAYAMHQADWLAYLLTDRPGHSDINNCLKTGYDPFDNSWPDWLMQIPGLDTLLPRVHTPGDTVAPVSSRAAEKFDLPATTQLVAGTTDSHAAILATGVHAPGEAVTSLGSTLVTKVVSETPVFDQHYGIYSQPFGQTEDGHRLWLVGGGSNSGGAVLRNYFTDKQMQQLTEYINPEQDSGLDYYPLNAPGERFPINDPEFQPRLSPRPDNEATFFQGLLEGIARIEQQAYQLLARLGAPYPTSIRTVGGGAKNQAWTRIRARYCQTEIRQSEYTEAAYGSALLARQASQ